MSATGSPWRRRALYGVAALGLITLAVLLARRVDPASVGRTLLAASPAPLAVACVVVVAVVFGAAWKVRTVCAAGGMPVSYALALRAVLTATALNPLVPGRGGELVKALVLAPTPAQRPDAIALVIGERVLDLAVVAGFAIVAGAYAGVLEGVLAGLAVWGVVVAAVAAGATLRTGLPEKVRAATEALSTLAADPSGLARAFGATAVVWSGNVVVAGACFLAAGADVSVPDVLAAAPVAILAGMIPVTVAGLGTREAALVLMLGDRADEAALVASGLLYTVVTVGVPWALGMVAAGWAGWRRVA